MPSLPPPLFFSGMQALAAVGFSQKVSSGGTALVRTEDYRHINYELDVLTQLSLFYGGVGCTWAVMLF